MEGDKRWRSICTLGMSFLSLIIVFLLSLALCPRFYWSEINQIVMFNSTTVITHIDYETTYIPTMYLNSTELKNKSLTEATNSLYQPPIDDINSNTNHDHSNHNPDNPYNPYNTTVHSVTYQHIGLHLNLWHINYCTQNDTNHTYYKTYFNLTDTDVPNKNKDRKFINNTKIATNETCTFITYRESGIYIIHRNNL